MVGLVIKEIAFSTSKKHEVIDITDKVKEVVASSEIKEGLCNIYVPHATAAITVNENADPNVALDLIAAMDKLVPEGKWKHDAIDNNGAAHIRSSIIGPSETIPVIKGGLALGTWQNVFLCDFDGPRKRTIYVKVYDK